MPAAVLLGGEQPWLRRLRGTSVAPQVGSIFNQAVRDNMAKRWNGVADRRTTESDATNHRRYRVTGKSLDAAGCTGEPLLVIAKTRVFLFILHCCIAFGRLFLPLLEAEVGNHPLEVGRYRKFCTATGVGCGWGRTMHRTGRRPTTCSGPGNRLRPCLHTSRRTPRGKRLWVCKHCCALCTRQFRLCHALRADLLVLRFGNTASGESGSHYLLFLEEDCDTMVESADACGVGLAAVSGDVLESTNYILKKGYNGHISRGGGAGKSAVEQEAMVVQQVWEWWFLTFDLPLLHYNTPHTAACTAASLLGTNPQAPSTQAPSATQLHDSSPIHGRRRAEEAAGRDSEGDPRIGGMLSVCCCSC